MTKTIVIESDDEEDFELECTQANPALHDYDEELTQRPYVEDAFVLKLFGEYASQLKDLQEITVSVDETNWSIGRSAFVEKLPQQAKMISRKHFEITSTVDPSSRYQFLLVSHSSNGTLVNDHLVMQNESHQLQKDDKIAILYVKNGNSRKPTLGWEFCPLVPLSEPKFKMPEKKKADDLAKNVTKTTTEPTKRKIEEQKEELAKKTEIPLNLNRAKTTKKNDDIEQVAKKQKVAEVDEQAKKAELLQFLTRAAAATTTNQKKETKVEKSQNIEVSKKNEISESSNEKEERLKRILNQAAQDANIMEQIQRSLLLKTESSSNKAIGKVKITSPEKNQKSEIVKPTSIQSVQVKRVQSAESLPKPSELQKRPTSENTELKRVKSLEKPSSVDFVKNKQFSYVGYSESEVNEHARKKIIDYLTKYGAIFTPNLRNSDYVIVHKDFLYDPSKNSDFLACKLNSKTIFLENFSCLDPVCKEKNLGKVAGSIIFPKTGGKIVVDSSVSRSGGEMELVFSSAFQAEGVWEVHSKEVIHAKQYSTRIKVSRIDEQRESDLNSKLYPQNVPLLIKHLLCLQREKAKECRHFILVSTDFNLKKIANQYQLLVVGPYDLKMFFNNLKQ